MQEGPRVVVCNVQFDTVSVVEPGIFPDVAVVAFEPLITAKAFSLKPAALLIVST